MANLKKLLFIVFLWSHNCHIIIGQSNIPSNKNQELPKLPKSFLIGEYEQPYESLLNIYDKMLVSMFNDDNEKAFALWTSILIAMEDYSKEMNIDLNGLKLWMNVFFNTDGSIQHIVYFPKPNSKNMEYNTLTAFFISFCKTYRMKENLNSKCLLNATATFPIHK
ncbi:MAG TPA: hypothetical protein PLD02_14225, partial [Saprospiraceae bacterium]|nr:hypothetical protein [Saprospiraceae bacterium]